MKTTRFALFCLTLCLISLPLLAQPAATAPAPAAPAKNLAWQWIVTPQSSTTTVRLGSLDEDKGYLFTVEVESLAAGLTSIQLADYFQTVADKQLFEALDGNEDAFAKKVAETPETYKGHYTLLQPVVRTYKKDNGTRGVFRYTTLPTKAIGLEIDGKPSGYNADLAGTKDWKLGPVTKDDAGVVTSVAFDWDISHNPQCIPNPKPSDLTGKLTIRKSYTIQKGSYSVAVAIELISTLPNALTVQLNHGGMTGIDREGAREDSRAITLGLWKDGEIQPTLLDQDELNDYSFDAKTIGKSDADSEPIAWVGYGNKFFAAAMYLVPRNDDVIAAEGYHGEYLLRAAMQTSTERTWQMDLNLKGLALPAAQIATETTGKVITPAQQTVKINLFAGPKLRPLLKGDSLEGVVGNELYGRLHYIDLIANKGCFCTFDWLRDGLMWLLGLFAGSLFSGNFGLAIILLVIIVRVALHPLTKKGQVSMAGMQKKMAKLKPKMDAIKKKYANDKANQQKEMMALYKQDGNPMTGGMLGCLPMLLQMPIWIALYSGLNTNVALRHAAFLPVWITDLAAPDALITWSTPVWLIGTTFNLLPILLVIAMYLQMKYNPQMAAKASTPEQKQQQKLMKFMMPAMMLFIFYPAPSGLNLYIMASTFMGLLEQHFIRKHIHEQEELEAARETVVEVTGKAPRSNRTQKPKGPFWTKKG